MYDVIIIGGGPAGCTAGIYCLRANLKVLILEKEQFGGQIASSPRVENYPGFKSISGAELVSNLYEQLDLLGADIELEEVLEIKPGKIKTVITDDNTYEAKAVIIATGTKHRLLNLPREQEMIGKGISFCPSCDGAFFKGKDVAVIGGANTAITNAIYLSKICNKVYLICRKDYFRGEKTLIDEVEKINNIEILYNANVTKLIGEDELEAIEVKKDAETIEIKVSGMFISIGMDAETKIVSSLLNLDDGKYIDSNDCLTSKEGIFVAGDCRSKKIRQLTTATSDGTIAATLAIEYLK